MSNQVTSLEIKIHSDDGEVIVNVFNTENRDDWGWMLLPFLNALSGAGFAIDPHGIFKHCPVMGSDTDAVEMACNSPAGRHFGE